MRQILILILLLPAFLAYGQNGDKLFYEFHLQPEKTYYQDRYYYQDLNYKSKSTFNCGIGAGVHYDLTKRLFVESGLDFISRKLLTKSTLAQSALPPPHQSFDAIQISLNSISLRILEFPLNFSCRLIIKEKMDLYLTSGISGNLLLNTFYDVDHWIGYEDTYRKFYLNGYSLNIGLGSDYKISKNYFVTARLAYSLINSVKEDKYLTHEIALTHEFLSFTLGVNVSNKYISNYIYTLLLKRKYNKLEKEKRCHEDGILKRISR